MKPPPWQGAASRDTHNTDDSTEPRPPAPVPDFNSAQRFLNRLDPEAETFTFQTFSDRSTNGADPLARVLHGTLDEHWPELVRLNEQGAGVFATLNAGDGNGRTNANVISITGLFLDDDGDAHRPPLEPHFAVETSPDRHHLYWLCNELKREEFTSLQVELAKRWGGDPAVKDLARVVRLPGTLNQKRDRPHLVVMFEETPIQPYGRTALLEGLDLKEGIGNTTKPALIITSDGNIEFDPTRVPPLLTEDPVPVGQRNTTASALTGRFIQQGDDLRTIKRQLDRWNGTNEEPLSVGELNTTIASIARTHTRNHPDQPIVVEHQIETPVIRSYRARDLGLDPRPTPPYLIDPILRQRENLLVAGPAKSQKTMWMDEAWLSLGLGRPLLGFEVPRPVRVYWVQAEMQWHQSRDRLLAHPWWREELERDGAEQLQQNLVMTDKLETLLFTPHGVQLVIEDIRRQFPEGLEVFMLDSLSSVYDQDSEDISAQMLTFLRQRIGMIREAFPGISVVLLHHTRKASIKELEADPFSAIRGSGALRGWYDSGIVMLMKAPNRATRFC